MSEAGDPTALEHLGILNAQLGVLQDLGAETETNMPTRRRVAQALKDTVWPVAHPLVAGIAIRLIGWFPRDRPGEVVVVLFGGDKARMGDVFYNSVGPRADAAMESLLYRTQEGGERDD